MVLLLTRSQIVSVLEMEDVIAAVEKAHADMSTGDSLNLGSVSGSLPGSSALMIPMAAVSADGTGGVKLLTDTPDNQARGLPRQMSTIALVDTISGICEAFLDGAAITQIRTAAASAVATKLLAREDATVLGFIGAGSLAKSHLRAIRAVRSIGRIVVWSRSKETASRFVRFAEGEGVPAEFLTSPRDVTIASDILCTLTPSPEPIVLGRWFRPGLHVNAVGSPPRKNYREIDSDGICLSRVVVDCLAEVLEKSGDVNFALAEGAIKQDHFEEELGQILTGARPRRTSETQITLYKSVGVAIQDVVTAQLVVSIARRRGLGTEVDLTT
ncbi:MAG: ornithine cyclodeaminase family protein [Acidimicrobiales bacterium]